jgi:hypothetical protein
VSRPGVLELQSEDLSISGASWPPYEEQHCLEETRFLSKAEDLSAPCVRLICVSYKGEMFCCVPHMRGNSMTI